MPHSLVDWFIIVFVIGVYLWLARRHRNSSRLPPYFKFSTSSQHRPPWETYKEWGESCGSALISLIFHRRDVVVVINEVSAAQELLERRFLNYSSRPRFHIMDLIGRQNNVVNQPYGPRLKVARRLINDTFSFRKSEDWMPIIQRESVELLSRILSDPKDFRRSIQRYVGSFIVRLTYDQDLDVDYLRLVSEVGEHTGQAVIPGRWWVNSYPMLKHYPQWAPGGGFQRWAKAAREVFEEFTSKPFNRVKEQLQQSPSSAPYSFVHKNLALALANDPQMESVVAGTAASLYSAAVDTITSILATFFLIMATHPEIQEKASAEIHTVIGRDRLPNFEDCASLPYIEALIKELHRYHPAVPLLVRSASKSDEYEGFFIPRNAWILTNIWGITHDKDEYEQPFRFDPEKYLQQASGDEGRTRLRDPRDFTFGMGRRRCPGMAIANVAVYLAITGILAAFSIEPDPNEHEKLKPPFEFTKSTISSPAEFRCLIQPRHDRVQTLIKHTL